MGDRLNFFSGFGTQLSSTWNKEYTGVTSW